jgi:hypothetical protein
VADNAFSDRAYRSAKFIRAAQITAMMTPRIAGTRRNENSQAHHFTDEPGCIAIGTHILCPINRRILIAPATRFLIKISLRKFLNHIKPVCSYDNTQLE